MAARNDRMDEIVWVLAAGALDVNNNGAVNNCDVLILTRHLNEWDVTIY